MAKKKVKTKNRTKVDLRQQAKDLLRQIDEAWYDFSVVAYQIHKEQKFLEWGYSSAREYCEEELGIDYRTWMYRVKMGEAIERYGLQKENILDLGWAKFKEIASLTIKFDLEEDEVEELVEKSKDMSSREVANFIRQVRNEYADKPAITKVTLKFRLINEAAEIVEQALEKAKEMIDTDDDAKALEYICADWLATARAVNKQLLRELEEIDEG